MAHKDQPIYSSNQTHTLHHNFFTPKTEPIATLLILHGMAEHSGRYHDFSQFLADHGIAVLTYDHLGHGKTLKNPDEKGYFHDKHPIQTLLKDALIMANALKNRHPHCPHFIMGHSMGSFIVRILLSHHAQDFQGAILMGTSGRDPLIKSLIPLTSILNFLAPKRPNPIFGIMMNQILNFKLNHHLENDLQNRLKNRSKFSDNRPKFTDKLMDKITELKTTLYPLNQDKLNQIKIISLKNLNNLKRWTNRPMFDWVSEEAAVLQEFEADPLCAFTFTNNGFLTLFVLMDKSLNQNWASTIDRAFPILFISGGDDAVGDMGAGVHGLVQALQKQGFKALSEKLYPNIRHEPLSGCQKNQAYQDILDWIKQTAQSSKKIQSEGEI